MAKTYTAGNIKCNKCNNDAKGSMYFLYPTDIHTKICRTCALSYSKEPAHEM